ncbi:aldo/keto reductase [Poseidonocella sp. HB161398]|uniref:aldo/keto reductase n=1 Tax=Poseidonocella sp. HB161398 TaxID=2320855 RepID=UPI0011097EDB|nr:aldo/keto reductase [Poseidonocella sp. HB161398]
MQTITTNGAEIPALGFGTFRMDAREVAAVLPQALRRGFRHVDTAQIHCNEEAVGAAIAASGVPRDEIFLTTKIWVDKVSPEDFLPSVHDSLRKLGTDHVDLLLLHWPDGSDIPREVQIGELNDVRDAGLTRHIGISNYSAAQMREAAGLSGAPLVTNQVEYHPWLSQAPVLAAASDLGMALTGYYAMADGRAPTDPVLARIGTRHGKSAAQVALRWQIQHGIIVLSKTARIERLAENLAIFDFTLSPEEMTEIHGLAAPNGRIVDPEGLAPAWD